MSKIVLIASRLDLFYEFFYAMTRQVQTLQISKMKNSSNKKEARPSVNRESIELLPKNEIKIGPTWE